MGLEECPIDTEDYPDLQIPSCPHFEMALDPPDGLRCSNTLEPHKFENNICAGSYLLFHPPTAPGADQTYAEYFKGKSRTWELRVQLRFKEPPASDEDLCLGVELEEYVPMSSTTKQVQSMVTAAIRSAVGGVYHSCGDDPRTNAGDLEKPSCVLPLC